MPRVSRRTAESPHRSRMQAVGRANTDIEARLRAALRRAGLRYRTNARVEDTKPDIVFQSARVAVFVDGCFWHGCPRHYVAPVGNAQFWRDRLKRNVARDSRDARRLRRAGWAVVRVWGCRVRKELDAVVVRVARTVVGRSL
jgi:DNA mismatch endonuclease (patch repair protein)